MFTSKTRLNFLVRFILLDRRGLLIILLKTFFTHRVGAGFTRYGNYFLRKSPIDIGSVVYSFGIGRNTTFDRAVADQHGCKIHAFDPTPLSIRYMAQNTHPLILFHPIGLWVEDCSIDFHLIRANKNASKAVVGEIVSGSVTNIHGFSNSETFTAPVKCLRSIMAQNNHDHIDILKMDIEGAALPVMALALQQKILPRQVVAELEVPKNAGWEFYKEIRNLLVDLRKAGYQLASLPARLHSMNFSIEIIAWLATPGRR